MKWILTGLAAVVVVYSACAAVLVLLGRRDARALAGFIPDCIVLMQRLLKDPGLLRRHKLLLAGLTACRWTWSRTSSLSPLIRSQ